MGTLPVPNIEGVGVFEFINYDCLYLVWNIAKLRQFLPKILTMLAHFWLSFIERVHAIWNIAVKQLQSL